MRSWNDLIFINWDNLSEMYHKYKDQMHCNSTGSQNYQTIVDYYEKQAWLKF